jgi:hypothetical protein
MSHNRPFGFNTATETRIGVLGRSVQAVEIFCAMCSEQSIDGRCRFEWKLGWEK